MRRGIATMMVGIALLVRAGATVAQENTPASPRHERMTRRQSDHAQDLSHQEAEIRRSRAVTRRIFRDRRASEEIRKEATELDALLDQRQQIIDRLEKLQTDFVTQHKAEIDEIEDLRRRAHELDDRLSAARKDVLDASKGDVATLKTITTHAADVADSLRERYRQDKRQRRQR